LLHQKDALPEKNNFDLLRFLFAGTVCLVHAFQLSGYKELEIINNFLSSKIAVEAFFIVSGFLIFMSYERSSSITSYARKRIRRIFPAYFLVVIVCAVGLILESSVSYDEYFSTTWLKYVLANLSFLNFIQHSLPGVFENNNIEAVNGALWTLKIEVMFYLSVPFFVYLFRQFGPLPILVLVYFLSITYVFVCSYMAEHTDRDLYIILSRQLPGQLSYFMAGAFFYYFINLFEKYAKYYVIFSILALSINTDTLSTLIEPFAIATLVIFFGLFLYMGKFGKFGDFSYGIYILHFPIIQVFLNESWFNESPWLFLISIIVVTFSGSILMWNFVEKKFLLQGSHYIATTDKEISTSTPKKKYPQQHISS
jgi:peptidoglycan/LPS O-acetylase OafA/YrhL